MNRIVLLCFLFSAFFFSSCEKKEPKNELTYEFFGKHVMTSQTHGAFMNLIDGNADIILTHRTISPDEKTHAKSVGVTLM